MDKPKIDTFEGLSSLARDLANQTIRDKQGNEITIVEALLRKLASHDRPSSMLQFLHIAYGKPEERIKIQQKSEDNVHVYLPVQDELPLDDLHSPATRTARAVPAHGGQHNILWRCGLWWKNLCLVAAPPAPY